MTPRTDTHWQEDKGESCLPPQTQQLCWLSLVRCHTPSGCPGQRLWGPAPLSGRGYGRKDRWTQSVPGSDPPAMWSRNRNTNTHSWVLVSCSGVDLNFNGFQWLCSQNTILNSGFFLFVGSGKKKRGLVNITNWLAIVTTEYIKQLLSV